MRIEIIRAPTVSFVEMLVDNIRPAERKRLEDQHWGAIGLIQARLIDLYWAADVAENASDVVTALVMGNCPLHTQMLAIAGHEAAVQTALAQVRLRRERGRVEAG